MLKSYVVLILYLNFNLNTLLYIFFNNVNQLKNTKDVKVNNFTNLMIYV